MNGDTSPFSYDRLRALFRLASEGGFASLRFGEEDDHDGPYILWRHDVDLDLDAAEAMAEVEAEMGVRATYFLMTRSWFYNLFSREAQKTIHRLVELGHDLGLHCALGVPREAEVSAAEVERSVDQEMALLEKAYPSLFRRVVSFHNPPASILSRDFPGFYSTYQERFFGRIKYLSDSNRRWRDGAPEDWLEVHRAPHLSILLHPEIWAHPGETMQEGMRHFLEARRSLGKNKLIEDDVEVQA